jgi:hypothetical protein
MMIMQDFKFSKPKRSRDIFDNRRLTLLTGKGSKNVLAFYQKVDKIYVQLGTFAKTGEGIDSWTMDFEF